MNLTVTLVTLQITGYAAGPQKNQSTNGLELLNSRTYNLPETTCSDFWLVNTNYLRLKDIQVGFNVPKEWLQAVHLGSARIYYSGTNLLTFSKTPQGIDPEAPAGWGAYYPHVKTHSIGINITL